MKAFHISWILLLLVCAEAFSTPPSVPMPVTGRPMPDYVFRDITHYKSNSASISDFRGKWLFLDLWSVGCTACVKSFRKIDQLQAKFKDSINWVLVGDNGKWLLKEPSAIEGLYETLRARQGLHLISAYDSVLFSDWHIPFVSYLYIVDPEGILRYQSGVEEISEENVQAILSGTPVVLRDFAQGRKDDQAEDVFKNDKPLIWSMVAEWNGEWGKRGPVDHFVKYASRSGGTYLVTKCSLGELYNDAYLGDLNFSSPGDSHYAEFYSYPILELRDTTLFDSDWGLAKGMYNYCQFIVPSTATEERVMTRMQEDLCRAFGHRAAVETRILPVWKLVAGPKARKLLQSKGGDSYNSIVERVFAGGFWVRNKSFREVYRALVTYVGYMDRIPTIDATGFTFNVDIKISADLISRSSIRDALKKYDLDFVLDTKEMKVVVIRDAI